LAPLLLRIKKHEKNKKMVAGLNVLADCRFFLVGFLGLGFVV